MASIKFKGTLTSCNGDFKITVTRQQIIGYDGEGNPITEPIVVQEDIIKHVIPLVSKSVEVEITEE